MTQRLAMLAMNNKVSKDDQAKNRMNRGFLWAGVAALLTLGLAGEAAPVLADGQTVLMVGHSPDTDPWWTPVKNGMKQAGEDWGVQTEFRNPPNGDLADMTRILETGAARNYYGVATTIPDFDVIKSAVSKVTGKGIPVVTYNSGTPAQSEKLQAIMHVGQPEYVAGHAAGERAKQDGIKTFVCVNHFVNSEASFERCKGFADAIGADYNSSVLDSGTDPVEVQSKTAAWLRNHPGTQAVMALGPTSAEGAIRAVHQMGIQGKIWFGTFDFSDNIGKAIEDGTIKFAIDQQPYLQGYIPVAVLAISRKESTRDPAKIVAILKSSPAFQARLKEYDLAPNYGPGSIATGPHFITKDNIAALLKYAGQYR